MKKSSPCPSLRAVEFILSRELENLGSLTEATIAQSIGVIISYLMRKFKEEHKITLYGFITREKIHTAISILEKHQEVPVDELAEKLGFLKVNRFIREFRDYVGVDPLTYRKLKHNRDSFLNNNN
jgi:AraC-like DNA-binding protein